MAKGIIILGLGPGSPEQLTRQAWEWLNGCGEVWLRTAHHPDRGGAPGRVSRSIHLMNCTIAAKSSKRFTRRSWSGCWNWAAAKPG